MRMPSLLPVIFLPALLVAPGWCQLPVLEAIGDWEQGPAKVCEFRGDRLLLGTGVEARLYGIEDPADPLLLGTCPLPFDPAYVSWISDSLALFASANGFLGLVDLAAPAAPLLRSLRDFNRRIRDLTVIGNRAYLSTQGLSNTGEIRVLSCEDADDPEELGSWSTTAQSRLLKAQDHLLVGSDALEVYRTDTPAGELPQQVAEVEGYWDSGGMLKDGELLYMPFIEWDVTQGIRLVDLADPEDPVIRAQLEMDCWTPQLLGSFDQVLYFGCERSDTLEVLDCRNPDQPVYLDAVSFPWVFSSPTIQDSLVAVIRGGALALSRLQESGGFTELAQLDAGHRASASVAATGERAWLSQHGRIVCLDVSHPQEVEVLSITESPSPNFWSTARLSLVGDTLLAVDGWSLRAWIAHANGTLEPLAPIEGRGAALLREGRLYTHPLEGNGIVIFDVSDWTQPVPAGGLDDAIGSLRLFAGAEVLVASNSYEGIQLLSLANPDSPVLLATIDRGLFPGGVYYRDGILYAVFKYSNWDDRLEWFDLADPANPEWLGSIPVGGGSLAAQGDFLHVGDVSQGRLSTFRLEEDGSLVLLDSLRFAGGSSIASHANRLYLAAGNRGLQILRNNLLPDPDFVPQLSIDLLPGNRAHLSWTRHPATPATFLVESRTCGNCEWQLFATTEHDELEAEIDGTQRWFRVRQVAAEN